MTRSNAETLCAAGQLAAQFTGLPDGIRRYHIINALKTVGHRLGFHKTHIAYIELMVGFTREDDWKNTCEPVMVWLSVEEIAKKLCITTRQVNRIEKALILLGAIHLYDYGNYRRFGCRQENGVIRFAYGVDLRPLGLLWNDLEALLAIAKDEAQQWKEARYAVSSLRRRIGDILRSQSPVTQTLEASITADEAYCARIKRGIALDVLLEIKEKLQKWFEQLEKLITENDNFTPPLHAKMSYGSDMGVRHHIMVNTDKGIKKVMDLDADAPNHTFSDVGLFEEEASKIEPSVTECVEVQSQERQEEKREHRRAHEVWQDIQTEMRYLYGLEAFDVTFAGIEAQQLEGGTVTLSILPRHDLKWMKSDGGKILLAFWQARIPEVKRIEFVSEEKACNGEEKEISVSVGFYKLYPILPEAIKSKLFMGSNASVAEVIEACEDSAYFFGVKSATMATLQKKIGSYHAALCMIVAAVKAGRGEVQHINAYLLGMLKNYERGKLNLDKTLYGLVLKHMKK